MTISAKQVKELRDRTGIALMACKKALEASNGDIEKAIEELRKRGASKAAEKSDRSTSEGTIATVGNVIVTVLCETDFVGKNQSFVSFVQSVAQAGADGGIDQAKAYFEDHKTDKIQELGENLVLDQIEVLQGGDVVGSYIHTNGKIGVIVALSHSDENKAKDIAMHIAAMSPTVVNPEDVDPALIEKEKEIGREQMKNEGKPANIIENIIAGKIKKFCAETALISQPFVKDPSMTVAEYLGDGTVVNFVRASI